MKIDSSTLSMDASNSHTDVKKNGRGLIIGNLSSGEPQRFNLSFGGTGVVHESFHSSRKENVLEVESEVTASRETTSKGHHALLTGMVEGVLKQEVHLKVEEGRGGYKEAQDKALGIENEKVGQMRIGQSPFSVSFGAHSLHYEHHLVKVASQGAITTSDGRRVTFAMDLKMERESFSYNSFGFQDMGGLFIDPLVLNFDTDLEILSETSFTFDLNGDGQKEQLTGLNSGSGFLALDVNGDNIINDGGELFGPMSGHGFQELQVHDKDQNSWIDENDPIFDQLKVWMQVGSEEEKLLSLKEAGVGAISLTSVESVFDLKDNKNGLLGQVASSGLFLMENGEVRSMQEIDYALPPSEADHISPEEPLADMPSAISALRFLLVRHRERVHRMVVNQTMDRFGNREKERLQDKFWAWQEKQVELG